MEAFWRPNLDNDNIDLSNGLHMSHFFVYIYRCLEHGEDPVLPRQHRVTLRIHVLPGLKPQPLGEAEIITINSSSRVVVVVIIKSLRGVV